MPEPLPPLLVIAGATATGKTGLAVRVATALRQDGVAAEIISADSRQVFRGLDIGTAKATPAERNGIPHHGLDLVDPSDAFSVADFIDHVATVLPRVTAAGGLAILVGGTGLYLRAVARGLDTAALPSDPGVRASIEAELVANGVDALALRLRAVAPDRAAAVDLRNPRRVVRALEIATIDGGRGPLPAPLGYGGPLAWIGLAVETATHRTWIERRARSQFAAGLIEEARALRERFDPGLAAFTAIGYHEAWAVIDRTLDLDAAIALDAQRNAAFAARQRTWFRREPDVTWLDAGAADPLPEVLRRARELIGRG